MTQYMPLFRSCSTIKTVTQLHAHLFVTGQHTSHQASTKLIDSYAQMGSLPSANLVFQTFPYTPDSFMYGVLIKRYVWHGFYEKALALYSKMLQELTLISSFIFPSVLRACSGIRDLGIGQSVHGRVIKCGFESDPVVQTSLLNMYAEASCLSYARKVFDEMPQRDVVSWSSVISMHVRNGEVSHGLILFKEMVVRLEPDYVTLLSVAEACGELSLGKQAKSVHGYVITRKIESNDRSMLSNSLIAMYGKCGDLYSARCLFKRVTSHCTSSWTAMITCYNHNGCYKQALDLFIKMQEYKAEPNAITMMGVLCSCARLSFLREGKSIHCFVIRKNLDPENDILGPTLIDLYANCGKLNTCRKMFDTARDRHVISWNMLISGYNREGMSVESLNLFKQMLSNTISPDEFTVTSVVSACGSHTGFFNLGTQVHGYVTKTGVFNEFVLNSLVDMYAKFGYVDAAYTLFNSQHLKSVVTWNSMMWGYCNNGKSVEAMDHFDKMYVNGQEMDDVTFLSAIQACSDLRDLDKGKWIHHKLVINGFLTDTYVYTALLDMYAKCGELWMAETVFDIIAYKSVVSWSAMIDAYGMHGLVDTAISVFDKMIESEMKPNEITFMNILSACSHAGYVEKGKYYFDSMKKDFGVEPKLEHFSCLIDLLSRAGHLDDAYNTVIIMPFPPNAGIWGSLLSGCRIHRRLDMIKLIQENIEKIDDTGYYTLLSNISAEGEDWQQFQTVRSMMKTTGLRKVHGCSTVQTR